MQKALDSIQNGKTAFLDSFQNALNLQESNITEVGETESTRALRQSFESLKKSDFSVINSMRYQLQQILSLNMEAIKSKNQKAEASAKELLCEVLVLLSLIFNTLQLRAL
jgi:hypothetical protein